jgi:hypothetical protein
MRSRSPAPNAARRVPVVRSRASGRVEITTTVEVPELLTVSLRDDTAAGLSV